MPGSPWSLLYPWLIAASGPIETAPTATTPLAVVERSITWGRGTWHYWRIDYTLRHDGPDPLTIAPAAMSAEVRGLVSNSRIPGHATPRPSVVTVSGGTGLMAGAEVIASTDADRRCRERAVLQVWAGEAAEPPDPIAKATVRRLSLVEQPTLTIPPGGRIRVRVRLEHEHHLYGPYDPLLGPRELTLRLGSAGVRDSVTLDRPRRPMPAELPWPPRPPADRLDARTFLTPPESLHVEAHVAGNQSYRFPERAVRYGTRYRLSFWYLIAPGTEGDCLARVAQFRNTSIWKNLPDGDHEQALTVVGRWTKVERTFRTQPDATSLLLEFRILRADVGELWIDDVSLEPVVEVARGP